VHGVCGISFSTVKTQYRDVWESGNFRFILQIGPAPHPELKDLPHVYEFARGDEDRAVFDILFGAQGLGRSFVAPPGVPAERVRVLREAFDATVQDEAFLKRSAWTFALKPAPKCSRSSNGFTPRRPPSPRAPKRL
jgi:hypothetical protein